MALNPSDNGAAECVHSFPTTPPLGSMDQPGACRNCGTTYEEAKQQMPAPATVVTSRSVSLNITGPDVPNRDGEGHIAPSRVDFTYRTSEVRAWLEGRWRRADGVLTDAPASQPYTGDMADWPDWLADLARRHDPRTLQPRRGDQFDMWLKAQRDASADYPEAHQATDGLLDLYRLHADMGVPLGGHVCEATVVGDCECLEQPAETPQ